MLHNENTSSNNVLQQEKKSAQRDKNKQVNHNSCREGLRNRRRINYAEIAKPKIDKLIQMPTKPHTPEHVGKALNSDIRSHWLECLFNYFEKLHNSGTLPCPFPKIDIPKKGASNKTIV